MLCLCINKISIATCVCFRLVDHYKTAVKQLTQITDATIERLTLELETCGNVKFEDGKLIDAWSVYYV